MPTIFTHAVIGSAIAKLAAHPSLHLPTVIACALLAVLPDIDGLFFGVIPYAHTFGHRGFTHSLLFAALCGLLTAALFVWREWITRAELWHSGGTSICLVTHDGRFLHRADRRIAMLDGKMVRDWIDD